MHEVEPNIAAAMEAARIVFGEGDAAAAIGPWDTAARAQQLRLEPGHGTARPAMLLSDLLVARMRAQLLSVQDAVRPWPPSLALVVIP